jgi:outer membrane protein OmpA-like peptidoglycan-associated protein
MPGLLIISGCGKRKAKKTTTMSEINIPTAEDGVKMFDENIGEFALVDDVARAQELSAADLQVADANISADDFAWIDNDSSEGFKKVFFDFDKFSIRNDQEASLAYNIDRAQGMVKENPDKKVTIVVNGHSCSSAGSAAYNLALSEKRARVVADKLVAAGVPQDSIKIVGRGFEVPAVDKNGNQVRGTKSQQWPNRRDEIILVG